MKALDLPESFLSDAYIFELYGMITSYDFMYVVVETKYTTHHIEKLMPSCADRGRIKWIAETNLEAFEDAKSDMEARRSHVDGGDLFPRLYFHAECFLPEFLSWINHRNLNITKVTKKEL